MLCKHSAAFLDEQTEQDVTSDCEDAGENAEECNVEPFGIRVEPEVHEQHSAIERDGGVPIGVEMDPQVSELVGLRAVISLSIA